MRRGRGGCRRAPAPCGDVDRARSATIPGAGRAGPDRLVATGGRARRSRGRSRGLRWRHPRSGRRHRRCVVQRRRQRRWRRRAERSPSRGAPLARCRAQSSESGPEPAAGAVDGDELVAQDPLGPVGRRRLGHRHDGGGADGAACCAGRACRCCCVSAFISRRRSRTGMVIAPCRPTPTVADFVVVVGAVVAEVALDEAEVAEVPEDVPEPVVAVVCEARDEALVPDVVGEVELTVVLGRGRRTGYLLGRRSARAPSPRRWRGSPTFSTMRRTLAPAMSRRWASDRPDRAACRVERLAVDSLLVGVAMGCMSPCEPRDPRTVG